jgi:hypothetical protein
MTKRSDEEGEQNVPTDAELGARGGNSARSIPPGVDLDAGYAVDDWPGESPVKQDSGKADRDG